MITNNNIDLLRMVFCRSMAVIFCFAFTSLYFQLPGLYGLDGIGPMYTTMKGIKDQLKIENRFALSMIIPTFLWFSDVVNPYITAVIPSLTQFNEVDNMMHFLMLFGSALSFLMATGFYKFLINPISFLILWLCYFSISILGGVFMAFEWDYLLLEVGFLTILFAPMTPSSKPGIITKVIRELIRWLMFRLMFGSGIVKLLSKCPTWWSLTALQYYFESQPLPNCLSWYAHQLPNSVKIFAVIDMFIVELLLPLLFYAPIRSLRIYSGIRQNILMIAIMLTGNYNFFNLLTMTVNLANFDDEFILYITPGWLLKLLRFEIPEVKKPEEQSKYQYALLTLLPVAIITGITFYIYSLFYFRVVSSKHPIHKLFTYDELKYFIEESPYPGYFISYVAIFIFSIYFNESRDIIDEILDLKSFVYPIFSIISSSFITIGFGFFFLGTLSVFGINKHLAVYGSTQGALLESYRIVNKYRLVREMTGIHGRDELIIYGSIDREEWSHYELYYKPTKTKSMPMFIIPHQPRLDWQMWQSALSTNLEANDMYLNILVQKLLQNSPSVLQLIKVNPFETEFPQYIKISKLTYHFSDISELSNGNWIPEKWWSVDNSKRIAFIKPIQLSDFGPHYSKSLDYPLHPMQSINLPLIYFSFFACLLAIDGVKLLISKYKKDDNKKSKEFEETKKCKNGILNQNKNKGKTRNPK